MSFLRFASAEDLEHAIAREYAELPHHSQPDNVIILIYAGHPYGKTEDTGWIFFQKNKTKRLLYRCGSKHINTQTHKHTNTQTQTSVAGAGVAGK